jgi:hypothetical protein
MFGPSPPLFHYTPTQEKFQSALLQLGFTWLY